MKKRLLTVLLAVCLVVALGTVTAWADSISLPAAEDGVITLTENVTLSNITSFRNKPNYVLDLNGYTLTVNRLDIYTNFIVRDSSEDQTGTITSSGSFTFAVWSGGELTIESGTINNMAADDGITIFNMGTVNVDGGEIAGETVIYNTAYNKGVVDGNIVCNITDGHINAGIWGVVALGRGIDSNGTIDNDKVVVNISGGLIESGGQGFCTNASSGSCAGYTLNMTGGTIDCGDNGTGMYLPAIGINNISGGTIRGGQGIRIAAGTLNITDGIIEGTTVASETDDDLVPGGSGGTQGAIVVGKASPGYVGDIIVNISDDAVVRNTATGEGLKPTIVLSDKNMADDDPQDVLDRNEEPVEGQTFAFSEHTISINVNGVSIDGDIIRISDLSNENSKDGGNTSLTIDSATVAGDVINQSKAGGVTVNSSIVTGSVTVAEGTNGTVAVFDSNIESKSGNGVILVNTAVGEGDPITDTGNYVAVINGVGYTDLAKAITAADDGDTIIVTGETKGDVVINKSVSDLTIRGEGGVIKNGTLSVASNGISLPDLTIEGLTFENANIVFTPNGASDLTNLTVTGNNFSGATSGLSAIHFNFGSLTDGSGVDFDGLTITDNNIEDITSGSNSGILIIGDGATKSDITITGNTVDGVGWNGLQLNNIAGGEIIVTDNVFENCGATSPDGVLNLYNTKADTFAVNENVVIPNAGQMYVSNIADDVDLSKNYWGTATPDFENYLGYADESEVQVVTEPYYEAITMRPEDLNTYVPPVNIPDTYDIDLIVGEGGEAKTNFSNASAGTTITVTVTPDDGYELDYITVDGERISGTSFKMPDHDVTVRVYFTDGTSALPFTDVSANQWFYDAVAYVYTNGMMEGDSATTFNPDGQMTRAMFWAVLGRIDGATITGANWVETARSWAMSEGVSDGTNPNDYVTREMMVTMLWRYAGEPASEESLSAYTDAASVSDWAAEAMSWALETGVIEGVTATTLQPQGTATRAQCATIFMRYDMI